MRLVLRTFRLQKDGHSAEMFEDSYEPSADDKPLAVVRHPFSCAVADGATDSLYSGTWARLLVTGFARSQPSSIEEIKRIVADSSIELGKRTTITGFPRRENAPAERARRMLGRVWLRRLLTLMHRRRRKPSIESDQVSRSLPWWFEEKLGRGSHSTLLGLTLYANEWKAIAVGDSCLFQVRGDELLKAFPLTHSSQFGDSPSLLSSNLDYNKSVWPEMQVSAGYCKDNDVFLLMTDALAHWFLSQSERDTKPWVDIVDKARDDKYAVRLLELVQKLRKTRAMRNDDVTLLFLTVLHN